MTASDGTGPVAVTCPMDFASGTCGLTLASCASAPADTVPRPPANSMKHAICLIRMIEPPPKNLPVTVGGIGAQFARISPGVSRLSVGHHAIQVLDLTWQACAQWLARRA